MVTLHRCVALSAAFAALTAAAPDRPATLAVTLKPVTAAGAVTAIDVTMALSGGVAQGFALTAPVVYPGAPGVADRMKDIVVTDASGVVPLATTDDPAVPGGFPYFRHWKAIRGVSYPVRITYRALVTPPGGPGGPSFGIRAVGGGVTGAGSGFLLLPEGGDIASSSLHWNLDGFAPGAVASTSFGDGDVTVTGAPQRLMQGWYLAGPAGRYPASGMAQGFSAAWLGEPTFDAPATMAWTARGHAYLASYFPHLKPARSYRVFAQFREQPPYGGATALEQSFMLSRGPLKPGEPRTEPRTTLFHEMIHQWTGGIEAPQGVSSWFSEGLTTYYQDLLQLRGGFQSVAEYQANINDLAEAYFTSKARNWSADAITKVGFSDEEVRHTPYKRSAMYFYDLDARIRAQSNGKRNLDSLMFPMFVSREKGTRFDQAAWIAMVTKELGPGEKGRFERLILAGTDTLDPRSDMFGPCFARVADSYRWARVKTVPDARCGAK